MIFPHPIIGPTFSEGDIVSFSFDDAELSLRLPVIYASDNNIDRICQERDFRGVNTEDWLLLGNTRQQRLATQSWVCEDDDSHLNIAGCFLKITVYENTQDEVDSCCNLNSEAFMHHNLELCKYDARQYDPETRPGWPTPENNFFAKSLNNNILNGFQLQLDLSGGSPSPQPLVYIPINKRFTLSISLVLNSLHYSDIENPYSEELLHKVKLDLFDDLLSQIRIDYSGETLEKIKQLKTQTSPA